MSFFELNITTNFSFLKGASHPEEYVKTAVQLGYSGLAITDECSLAGVVRAHIEAKKCHLPLIIGSRVTVKYQQTPLSLIFLCTDREAYADLSSLITLARRRAAKGSYEVKESDLLHFNQRLLCLWFPSQNILIAKQQAKWLNALFPNRLWIAYHRLRLANDFQHYQHCLNLSTTCHIPIVAQNKVVMHTSKRLKLHHCLTAIRLNASVQNLGTELLSNAEQHLRALHELNDLYPKALLDETLTIARRCHFSLDQLRYDYPNEVIPKSLSPTNYLRQLCEDGAKIRWPSGMKDSIKQTLDKELKLIHELAYEHYFLTVYDIVAFARAQGILCQGRGSAANSVVCFCLFITEVDPEKSQLLFERFISKERDEPPDIDVDFEHQRREEVIQYIYKKYSRERAALAATVITYRMRSAIRDVGKTLGIDLPILEHLSKSLAWWDKPESLKQYFSEQNLTKETQIAHHFYDLVMEILKFPRHLSQHVGGFIITQRPISTLVPVENASMPDRTVIQWDKYDIEALKLLKIDVLALGMLSMLRRCISFTKNYSNIRSLSDIPKDDPLTYKMLTKGDSVGVFQVESRAQMSMLPRLKPACFYDLVIEIAIVRPGPIQGNMVHPYLKRRENKESVSYPNKAIQSVLERTLGIPIFQEQVIQLAMVAAGFSGGEADQLRRAMATWGRNGDLFRFKDKLIQGMLKNDYSEEYAERVFEQMKGFGSYGFPESHSASFAILAYFSAWMKRHHSAAFYCALLNSQPMGFYSPSQLIQDATRHKIKVLPIDVDHSEWESILVDEQLKSISETFSKENHTSDIHANSIIEKTKSTKTKSYSFSIRLGFHLVKGFRSDAAHRLVHARKQSPFKNIHDLVYRAKLNRQDKQALVRANTLPRLSEHRYHAQWLALAVEPLTPLLAPAITNESDADSIEDLSLLPTPTVIDNMLEDYQTTGFTLNQHPIAILRDRKVLGRSKQAKELKTLRQGQFVCVSGIVTCRQRPATAAGVLFLTLEDETGNMNIIVWKDTAEKFRKPILTSRLLQIKGTIEREKSVVHIVAGYIHDLSEQMPSFKRQSRDFH